MEDVCNPELNDTLEQLILERKIPLLRPRDLRLHRGPPLRDRRGGAHGAHARRADHGHDARARGAACARTRHVLRRHRVISNYATGMTSYVTDDGIGTVMGQMRDKVFDVLFRI